MFYAFHVYFAYSFCEENGKFLNVINKISEMIYFMNPEKTMGQLPNSKDITMYSNLPYCTWNQKQLNTGFFFMKCISLYSNIINYDIILQR